jgi:hypothetical protein
MDIASIREFVNDHLNGVLIRMVDGTEYKNPHRDYVWFTPSSGKAGSRFAPSFYIDRGGVGRLVNAPLVAQVVPLKSNGHGRRQKKRSA